MMTQDSLAPYLTADRVMHAQYAANLAARPNHLKPVVPGPGRAARTDGFDAIAEQIDALLIF